MRLLSRLKKVPLPEGRAGNYRVILEQKCLFLLFNTNKCSACHNILLFLHCRSLLYLKTNFRFVSELREYISEVSSYLIVMVAGFPRPYGSNPEHEIDTHFVSILTERPLFRRAHSMCVELNLYGTLKIVIFPLAEK